MKLKSKFFSVVLFGISLMPLGAASAPLKFDDCAALAGGVSFDAQPAIAEAQRERNQAIFRDMVLRVAGQNGRNFGFAIVGGQRAGGGTLVSDLQEFLRSGEADRHVRTAVVDRDLPSSLALHGLVLTNAHLFHLRALSENTDREDIWMPFARNREFYWVEVLSRTNTDLQTPRIIIFEVETAAEIPKVLRPSLDAIYDLYEWAVRAQ